MNKEGKIKIGEHIRIVPGFPFNSRLFNTEGEGLPLIRIRDLLKSKIETYFNGEYTYDFIISEGDILIGMDGDFHIVRWSNKKKALLNQRIMKVAQKEGALIDINYFYYFLFPLLKKVWDRTTATTVKHLSTYDISEAFEIFPSVPEQRQIATILSTADSVIEKTQAAIAKYKAIKQGMLQDLFTRGIDATTGKLRPSYQDAPELYKESKLGWIPKDWEDKELMHYLSFISYGFTNPMPETQVGPYLITAANVNFGKVQYDTCRKTSQVAFDTLLTDKSKPRVNDILLTKDGTLGRIALVEREDLCINQSVAVLRPNTFIYPLFLKILLESESYQKTMLDEAGGSTIKHIYITIVDKMPIGVPQNMDEQKEIAIRIKTIDQKLQTEQDFLHKQQQIKAGLMNDLLSGKKKVTVKEELETQTRN